MSKTWTIETQNGTKEYNNCNGYGSMESLKE